MRRLTECAFWTKTVGVLFVASLAWIAAACQAESPSPQTRPAKAPAKAPAAAIVKTPVFPLEFRIVDPDNADNATKKPDERKLPPLILSFPKGLTNDDVDATGPIGRLEAFRGKSALLPASNDDAGLPVLLTGLRFLERRDQDGKLDGYDVELQGEFNAVKVPASKEAMETFLAHKPAIFELESKLQYGIIATHSTTKLEIQWTGDKLYILSVEGDFSFREGFYTYKSATIKKLPPRGRSFLFFGEPGELPKMRIL